MSQAVAACVKCGTCKTYCPSYDHFMSEASSPRGRIAIIDGILKGHLYPSRSALQKIFSCVQCGACSSACPPGIDIPEIIFKARHVMRSRHPRDIVMRRTVKAVIDHPDIALAVLRLAERPLMGYMRRKTMLPDGISFKRGRDISDIPSSNAGSNTKGRVLVFAGCSSRYVTPALGRSLVALLTLIGYEVISEEAEVCCGVPFRALGMEAEAKKAALRNIATISGAKADAVISPCPTCVTALRYQYPVLVGEGIDNAVDISTFLVENDITLPGINKKVYYHEPCHIRYGLMASDASRELLERIGLQGSYGRYQECCGFGGTYSLTFAKASMEQAIKVVQHIVPEEVYTACPGCMLQLRKVLRTGKVLHLVQVIEEALREQILL